MLQRLSGFFKPPVFPEDEDKTRKAFYAHFISLVLGILILVYQLYLLSSNAPAELLSTNNLVVVLLGIVGLVNWWLIRKGNVFLASLLLVGLFWTGANGLAASGYGIRDASFIVNLVVMLIAALLLGWPASILIGIASILVAFILANREATGLLVVTSNYGVERFAVDISVVFVLGASFIYILVDGLEKAVKQSRKNLAELEATNAELHHAQSDLQVRSEELVATNEMLQKRTERLRAVAEVARTATAVQDFDQLLPLITNVVSKQLGYYHVGIFLLDEFNEYAILRAANTEGGLSMLAREHRLKIGEQGLVGLVAYQGKVRVARDVGEDAAFFNNPDLPDTHAEVCLPLKFGPETIGVLDIQATKTDAFSQDDVAILSVLADQVSVAIQNARSFEQAQRGLRDAEIASSQLTREAWTSLTETIQSKGYRFDGIKSEPLKAAPRSSLEHETLSVPVELRGQTIGRLKLRASSTTRKWTEDELAIIESAAARIALALESARLLEEAQKRAARETFLSTVGAKLGASFQLDSILRDTVEELGQNLKSSTVSFQLVNPSAPPGTDSDNDARARKPSA
jgi:GAF domain-containing protein